MTPRGEERLEPSVCLPRPPAELRGQRIAPEDGAAERGSVESGLQLDRAVLVEVNRNGEGFRVGAPLGQFVHRDAAEVVALRRLEVPFMKGDLQHVPRIGGDVEIVPQRLLGGVAGARLHQDHQTAVVGADSDGTRSHVGRGCDGQFCIAE